VVQHLIEIVGEVAMVVGIAVLGPRHNDAAFSLRSCWSWR
jgi:hypothetical protein